MAFVLETYQCRCHDCERLKEGLGTTTVMLLGIHDVDDDVDDDDDDDGGDVRRLVCVLQLLLAFQNHRKRSTAVTWRQP